MNVTYDPSAEPNAITTESLTILIPKAAPATTYPHTGNIMGVHEIAVTKKRITSTQSSPNRVNNATPYSWISVLNIATIIAPIRTMINVIIGAVSWFFLFGFSAVESRLIVC
jgi:hypothetical protein